MLPIMSTAGLPSAGIRQLSFWMCIVHHLVSMRIGTAQACFIDDLLFYSFIQVLTILSSG